MQLARPVPGRLEARAATSVYVGLVLVFGFLGILYAIAARQNPDLLVIAALLVVAGCACFSWVFSYRLLLSNEEVVYKTALRTTRLKLDEIERVSIRIGVFSYRDRLRPTTRLEFQSRSGRVALRVNMKVFRRPDLDRILQHLAIDET